MTPEDYMHLFEEQEGNCAICGRSSSNHNMTDHLIVDHCHDTNNVRGLLCNNCNFLIGHAKDNIQVLRSAAKYLQRSKTKLTHDTCSSAAVL